MAGLAWPLAASHRFRGQIKPSQEERRGICVRQAALDKRCQARGQKAGGPGPGWGGCYPRQGGSRERTGLGDEGIPVGN